MDGGIPDAPDPEAPGVLLFTEDAGTVRVITEVITEVM